MCYPDPFARLQHPQHEIFCYWETRAEDFVYYSRIFCSLAGSYLPPGTQKVVLWHRRSSSNAICRVSISAGRRMGTCEEMAGALEERMRWMAGATEAADKAKAASDASVEAAKTALKSEPDPRGGTQVNVCFHDVLRQIKLPQLFSAWLNIARWVDILAGLSCVLRLYRSTRVSRPLAGLEPGKRACKRPV